MKPVVIIPALNPNEKLVALVKKLRAYDLDVVEVNDGSSEECRGIFNTLKWRHQCDVLVHPENRGKGAALKTGIRYAQAGYPRLVSLSLIISMSPSVLTAGGFLKGILQIAGTESAYTACFDAAGWLFIGAGIAVLLSTAIRFRKRLGPIV